MGISLHIRVHAWFRKKYHDYVVFTKSIFFILGLILSYKLVEKTFLNILITHLTSVWDEYDLRRAVVVVYLQEGTSEVLVTFFAYVTDVYTGRFKMVVFSTVVCITGLFLNAWAAGDDDEGELDLRLFYPALGLMTLAQAALTITLQAFLDDQLRPTGGDDENTAWRRRSEFWWYFVSVTAAIFAQFGPLARLPFGNLARISTGLMGVGLLVFWLGTRYYNFVDTIENPFKDVATVIVGAIAKRKVEYGQMPQQLSGNSSGDVHISPHVPWLRWLDRAAIVQELGGNPSDYEQVRGVKLLLTMLPLWSSFLTLSLVAASGSTFFLQEAFSLSPEDLGPILFFANLQRFTEFAVSGISSYVIKKLRERKQYNGQKMELVRIGVGMSCCVLCCIAAWATATRRQLAEEGDSKYMHMSVYLLTPQYLLLGLMGGLSVNGLESFYESQVSVSLSTYGPPFGEFMMGVGKFLGILGILIFSSIKWFQSELVDSRLSKYYILLAVLSFGNVMIYCLIACWYVKTSFVHPT